MLHALRERRRTLVLVVGAASVAALIGYASGGPLGASAENGDRADRHGRVAKVEIFAPEDGARSGRLNRGFFVDLAVDFRLPLARTGFTSEQLTGPATHQTSPPFPKPFGRGQDESRRRQGRRREGSPGRQPGVRDGRVLRSRHSCGE